MVDLIRRTVEPETDLYSLPQIATGSDFMPV